MASDPESGTPNHNCGLNEEVVEATSKFERQPSRAAFNSGAEGQSSPGILFVLI